MEITLIPGYFDLYGDIPNTYENVVAALPSETLIISAAALNDELYALVDDPDVQLKMLQRLTVRFSSAVRADLENRIQRYRARSNYTFTGQLFERIVFLEWIAHEVQRNTTFELVDDSPRQELNLMWGYLLMVDELHLRNNRSFKKATDAPADEHTLYRQLWVPLLYQYQYNDHPYAPYHIYKVTSFLLHALDKYRGYLREYLQARGMKSISELLNSFFQISSAAVQYNADQFLPGLKYINPRPGTDTRYLDSLTINPFMGQKADLATIKRYPLYFRKDKGYIILDRGFYYRKMYLGPYFELYRDTTLSKQMDFNRYSGRIAKEVLEEICFQHILQEIKRPAGSTLLFDSDGSLFPDGYYREPFYGMLFELKAYIFTDELPANPDFDTLKAYLESRFVSGEGGKKKGIGQLCEKLEQLALGQAPFDPALPVDPAGERLPIYPIICFDDFNFTLPGINDYLAQRMDEMLSEKAKQTLNIQPLVLLNLDILYRFAIGGGTFSQLRVVLDDYFKIISARRDGYNRTNSADQWLQSMAGFDELFHTMLFDKIGSNWQEPKMNGLLKRQNITQELLDTIV